MHSIKHEYLSESDYLTQEAQAPYKHEYVDGQIYAMSGASIRHNRIVLNLVFAWRTHSRCRVTTLDVKLRARRAYYYPDVMLTCEPESDPMFESQPCIIAEVLSPSTEVTDRGEKLRAYQHIASLQAYVLVSQDERSVEIYRRAGEIWTYEAISDGRAVPLPCVDQPLTLDEIYAGVVFDSTPMRAPVPDYAPR